MNNWKKDKKGTHLFSIDTRVLGLAWKIGIGSKFESMCFPTGEARRFPRNRRKDGLRTVISLRFKPRL